MIEPEVRTGVNYPFQSSTRPDIQASIKRGELLATVVTEWGFDVAFERSDNFHKWLMAFEADLAKQTPSGVAYRGTYAVVVSSEKSAGNYRTIWAFDGFDAVQRFAEATSDASSQTEFNRLVRELMSFRDRAYGAGWSQSLLQPAASSARIETCLRLTRIRRRARVSADFGD